MNLSSRLALAIAGLVFATAAAVGLLGWREMEAHILPGEIERFEAQVRVLARDLGDYVRNARADMLGLRAIAPFHGFVRSRLSGGTDPYDGSTERQWLERMGASFLAQLRAKPWYVKLQLFGTADGDRAILRADRLGPDGAVRLVPEAELR